MSLNKQLINVFSSPSTWNKSILTPPPTEKDKKRHFQIKKPFTDQCHFPVLICECLSPLFSQSALNVANRKMCVLMVYGGRCCGGGGSCYN